MKASISIITYNHEKFIEKALDSVFMQITDFDFEVVIGEDCSSDATRNIIEDYVQKYPGKIKAFFNDTNMGMYRNSIQVLQACKGEYIAILEGDDHWTSPYKLQKQVDYLDNNPDSAICFHNVMIEYADGSTPPTPYCNPDQKERSTAADLLIRGNFIPTCSKMFRKDWLVVPDWIHSLKMGDWPCDILMARHGTIGYINEIMGVYVIHQAGAWYALRQDWEGRYKANIAVYLKLYDEMSLKYKMIIRRLLHESYVDCSEKYDERGDSSRASEFALKSFTSHYAVSGRSVKILLKLFFPSVFRLLKSIKGAAYSLLAVKES